MANAVKHDFLAELQRRFPNSRKLVGSQSLFDLGAGQGRVYIRYSKTHGRGRTFYGLRACDLHQLEGHRGLICFLWDGQTEPLLVPFDAFEDVFHNVEPAADGQFKAAVCLEKGGMELCINRAGRFNVESYLGWNELNLAASAEARTKSESLSHCQVQSLLAAIGFIKCNDVWVPMDDRCNLDKNYAGNMVFASALPAVALPVLPVVSEVDVIWVKRGSGEITAMFEVEHSTPVYSGLLRFNDFHLTVPTMRPRFSIVSNDARRSLFVRQINRPTFKASGLGELCTFLEYANVHDWYARLASHALANSASI